MPNKNPKYKWPLPSVVDPDRICMSINVPNDPNHISAFRDAILRLARAYNWDDDTEHTAKDVAAVWDEVYREVTDCMALFDVRQNEEMPCKLEKTDDGETWEQWADLQLCPPRIRTNKGKLQWFNGTSWGDLPDGGDERFDGDAEPQWTDPPSGQSGACLAAENIVASYVTMLTQVKSGLEAVLTLTGIVDIVAGYIGTQTLFPPALVTLNVSIAVGSLAALGIGTIDEFLESEDIDTLKCILDCHAGSDGAFTADEFDAIQDEVESLISVAQRVIMGAWLDSYGPVGLTRSAAANGILDGDCADCGCDITVTTPFGTGAPFWMPPVGEQFTVTSVLQASAENEQTLWTYWSDCCKLKIVAYGGDWELYDRPTVHHVYAYGPDGVAGSALGSYNFFDYPTYTELPSVGSEFQLTGFYSPSNVGHVFSVTFEVMERGC